MHLPLFLFSRLRFVASVSLSGLVALSSTAQTSADSLPHFEIAVLRDGPSWYFDPATERALEELRSMAVDQYTFSVRDEFNANYQSDAVSTLLQTALTDDTIDLIYAGGTIATELAASLTVDQRTKPIVGGALQFSDVRGTPISSEGTSTLPNYTFTTSPRRVAADIELLTGLTDNSTVYALIDELLLPALKNLDEAKGALEEQFNIRLELIPAADTATATLSRLPTDVASIYVSILPRMAADERQVLFSGLAQRGVVSVSMAGHRDVRLGALAALAPDNDQALARRVALNIHQLFQGLDTSRLPVYLPVYDRLLINMDSAAVAGWSPDYDTALAAETIGEGQTETAENLTLAQALHRAKTNNIDVTISTEDQVADEYDAEVNRSGFSPQLEGSGSLFREEKWSRINPATTPRDLHQETLGVKLTKILFSDELRSVVRAQQLVAEASSLTTLSSELDAIGTAAARYFDVLTASSLYDIERENLALTENNFQLAQLRIEIGAAEPVEAYRWEQLRARVRATLFQRERDRSNAWVAFNVQIGAPRTKSWRLEDFEISDTNLVFLDRHLQPLLGDAKSFQQFGQFLHAFAVDNSPELLAFDIQLASQGILLAERERRFIPEISGFVDYDHVFQGSEFFNTGSENRASAGIQLQVPLFEGGKRKFESLRFQAQIRGLSARREKALQQIEQRALAAFYEIGAAHPNLRLSRVSLDAAEKTYSSIQEKYSQGAASILDLLDAQESLLSQKQQLVLASYGYLSSVHELQRSIAWFEFQKSPAEIQRWVSQLKGFLTTGQPQFDAPSARTTELRDQAQQAITRSTPSPSSN